MGDDMNASTEEVLTIINLLMELILHLPSGTYLLFSYIFYANYDKCNRRNEEGNSRNDKVAQPVVIAFYLNPLIPNNGFSVIVGSCM